MRTSRTALALVAAGLALLLAGPVRGVHSWLSATFVPPTPWSHDWGLSRDNATVTVTNRNPLPLTLNLGWSFISGVQWVSPTNLVIPAGGSTNLTATCTAALGTGPNLDPRTATATGTWTCGDGGGAYLSIGNYTIHSQ